MYENIQRSTFNHSDNNIFDRIGAEMNTDNFGLTVEQIEILYNLEYYKTLNDIRLTKTPVRTEKIKQRKHIWLREWKNFISKGFSSFLQIENAEIQWYTVEELVKKLRKISQRILGSDWSFWKQCYSNPIFRWKLKR